ncbi:hypothetical protein EJ110_NYTH08632 [Nymphaea thermarum]|nr:hypothetical protein EJ110_NYTH08632 [Nymphaea thermarum]
MEMDPSASSSFPYVQNGEAPDLRGLLTLAREFVQQGQPSHALQAVVMAVKSSGGDAAVLQTLDRARELYRKKMQANVVADELASLFAECVISEAQPLHPAPLPFDTGGQMITPDAKGNSILAKAGRKQIMLDAFADGSSFICLQCGGLVSNLRKDEHFAYWCCAI